MSLFCCLFLFSGRCNGSVCLCYSSLVVLIFVLLPFIIMVYCFICNSQCWIVEWIFFSDQESGNIGNILGEHQFVPKGGEKSVKFVVTRGDYSPLMALVVDELSKAQVGDHKTCAPCSLLYILFLLSMWSCSLAVVMVLYMLVKPLNIYSQDLKPCYLFIVCCLLNC